MALFSLRLRDEDYSNVSVPALKGWAKVMQTLRVETKFIRQLSL
jgi:hypothetical protein